MGGKRSSAAPAMSTATVPSGAAAVPVIETVDDRVPATCSVRPAAWASTANGTRSIVPLTVNGVRMSAAAVGGR